MKIILLEFLLVTAAITAVEGVDNSQALRSQVLSKLKLNSNQRIRDGQTVKSGYDWVVDIIDDTNYQLCTGSLIANEWVLTAAHCWGMTEPKTIYIRHYDNKNKGNTITRTVASYRIHQEYGISEVGYKVNDIALIKLNQAVNDVPVVKLKSVIFPEPINWPMKAFGWGFTGPDEAQTLQTTKFTVATNSYCSQLYHLNDNEGYGISQLCAWDATGATGGCKGDSGGPLIDLSYGDPPLQVGVASFGEEDPDEPNCLVKNIPVVYSDVGYFYEWIQNNMY